MTVDVCGQFSGEVFCPPRRAHIAILRCAEYQETNGCHVNCPNAATKAQIAEVRQELNGSDGGQLKDSPARELPAGIAIAAFGISGKFSRKSLTTTLRHAKRSKEMIKKPLTQKKPAGKSPVTYLREQLHVWEAKLQRAEAEASRSKLVIHNFRATIEALTESPASHSATLRNGTGGSGHAKETLAEADVRLKRTEKYGAMPINDAVKEILAAAGGEPLHYNDLAKLIFQIHNKTDLVRAKACLSSRISHGVKQKMFKALGGGRFTVET